LQPGDIVTATDGQGEFNFIGLAPGEYTLTISYVGFTSLTKQVTVAAGQGSHIEAKLDVSAKSEEVSVVADRPHGEAEAINRQRTSDNILQVLPSDVIQALPNANIAAYDTIPYVELDESNPDLGPHGPGGDVYFYPHLQLDAQASYRVRKDLTFLVQGLNLTNEVFGFYNGSPDYVLQREYYNRTYSFGLRWEPRREF
jgi:hypothetical protein